MPRYHGKKESGHEISEPVHPSIEVHKKPRAEQLRCLRRSSFKGVFRKRKSWSSYLWLNGKTLHLGTYPTVEEAAIVRDVAARKHFGPDYKDFNFPCSIIGGGSDLFGNNNTTANHCSKGKGFVESSKSSLVLPSVSGGEEDHSLSATSLENDKQKKIIEEAGKASLSSSSPQCRPLVTPPQDQLIIPLPSSALLPGAVSISPLMIDKKQTSTQHNGKEHADINSLADVKRRTQNETEGGGYSCLQQERQPQRMTSCPVLLKKEQIMKKSPTKRAADEVESADDNGGTCTKKVSYLSSSTTSGMGGMVTGNNIDDEAFIILNKQKMFDVAGYDGRGTVLFPPLPFEGSNKMISGTATTVSSQDQEKLLKIKRKRRRKSVYPVQSCSRQELAVILKESNHLKQQSRRTKKRRERQRSNKNVKGAEDAIPIVKHTETNKEGGNSGKVINSKLLFQRQWLFREAITANETIVIFSIKQAKYQLLQYGKTKMDMFRTRLVTSAKNNKNKKGSSKKKK